MIERQTNRTGLTFGELLVVLAIIALLVGVLLLAVQKSRAAARRATCANRMRQLAVAMQQFATANRGVLPNSGTFGSMSSSKGDFLVFGSGTRNWVVDLLPYTEESKIADRWQYDHLFFDTWPSPSNPQWSNAALGQTKLALLTCPDALSFDPESRLSYVVNGGVNIWWDCPKTGLMYFDWATPGIDFDGNGVAITKCSDRRPETKGDRQASRALGLLWPGSTTGRTSVDYKRTLQSIVDGTSHTIMLAENLHAGHGPYLAFWLDPVHIKTWANPDPNIAVFHISDEICPQGDCRQLDWSKANSPNTRNNRYHLPQNINGVREKLKELQPYPQYGWPYPSSMHTGGINVAMCDGSTRFIQDSVDGTVFAKLVTPAATRVNSKWPVAELPLGDAQF